MGTRAYNDYFNILNRELGERCLPYEVCQRILNIVQENFPETVCIISNEQINIGEQYKLCTNTSRHAYNKEMWDMWVAQSDRTDCLICKSRIDDKIYVN